MSRAAAASLAVLLAAGTLLAYPVQAQDSSPPQVSSLVTQGSGGGVTSLLLSFNEAVDATAATVAMFSVSGCTCAPLALAGNTAPVNSFRLTFQAEFPTSMTPQVTYSGTGVRDLAGNPLAGFTRTATANVDTTVPVVTAISVVGNAAGANALVFTFSEAMDARGASTAMFQLTGCTCAGPALQGNTASTTTMRLNFQPDNAGITPTVGYNGNGLRDVAGNFLAPFTRTASSTVDGVNPTVPSNDADGVRVEGSTYGGVSALLITFSEAVDSSAATLANFQVTGCTPCANLRLAPGPTSNTLRLAFDTQFTTGLTPTVTYSGGTIKDPAGNPVAAFTRTARDLLAPGFRDIWTSGSPQGGVESIRIQFTEAVDARRLDNEYFLLELCQCLSPHVEDNAGLDDQITVRFQGEQPTDLRPQVTYFADIPTSDTRVPVRDLSEFNWRMETRIDHPSRDLVSPGIVETLSRDMDGDGLLDAYRVRFTESMNDDSFVREQWHVAGTITNPMMTGSGSDSDAGYCTVGTCSNDDTVYFNFEERATLDSGTLPQLTYDAVVPAGNCPRPCAMVDRSSNGLSIIGLTQAVEQDGVPGRLLRAVAENPDIDGGGTADTGTAKAFAIFSEAVVRQSNAGPIALGDLGYANDATGGATGIASLTQAAGSRIVALTLDATVAGSDADASPDRITLAAGTLRDLAGNAFLAGAVPLETDTTGPAAATFLAVTGISDTGALASWLSPASTDLASVEIRIKAQGTGSTPWADMVVVGNVTGLPSVSQSIPLSVLTPSRFYEVAVRPRDVAGNQGPDVHATFTTLATPPPSSTQGTSPTLAATVGAGGQTLTIVSVQPTGLLWSALTVAGCTQPTGTVDAGDVLTGCSGHINIAEAGNGHFVFDYIPSVPTTLGGVGNLHVVTGSLTNRTARLEWIVPAGPVVTGYRIRLATTPVTEATFDSATVVPPPAPDNAGTTQGVALTNLVPDRHYYAAVRTVAGAQVGPLVSLDFTTLPNATLLQVTSTTHQHGQPSNVSHVELKWNKLGTLEVPAYYRIATSASNATHVGPQDRRVDATNTSLDLADGIWHVRVAAFLPSYSVESSALRLVIDRAAPGALGSVTATPAIVTVGLNATLPSDAGEGAKVLVRRVVGTAPDGATWSSFGSQQTLAAGQGTVTGLKAATAYTFALRTIDAAGNQGPFILVSATTQPDVTPPAGSLSMRVADRPDGVAIGPDFKVTWAAAVDGETPVTYRYGLVPLGGDLEDGTTSEAAEAILTDVPQGSHEFLVQAVSDGGPTDVVRHRVDVLYLAPRDVQSANGGVRLHVERNGAVNKLSWTLTGLTVEPAGVQVWAANSPYLLLTTTSGGGREGSFDHEDETALDSTRYLVTVYFTPNAEHGFYDADEGLAPDTAQFPGVGAGSSAGIDWLRWALVAGGVLVLAGVGVLAFRFLRRRSSLGNPASGADEGQAATETWLPEEDGYATVAAAEESRSVSCYQCSTVYTATGALPLRTTCPSCGAAGMLS